MFLYDDQWKFSISVFNNLTLELVESTKIEYVSFRYKIAISEANVKTNRILKTKWTYHKERSFVSD